MGARCRAARVESVAFFYSGLSLFKRRAVTVRGVRESGYGKALASTGFVKLRRGINEHLVTGKITPEEYAVYVFMIVEADHRTGIWKGSGEAIAHKFRWCLRRAQMVLASIFSKGYAFSYREHRGRGNYPIKINKYFNRKAHVDAPDTPKGAPGCALIEDKAHVDATYQEVKQEELLQEKSRRAKPARVPTLRTEAEQRRIVVSRDSRKAMESKAKSEALVGASPHSVGAFIKPEALERWKKRN